MGTGNNPNVMIMLDFFLLRRICNQSVIFRMVCLCKKIPMRIQKHYFRYIVGDIDG